MEQGVTTQAQQQAYYTDNLLTYFCNFNNSHTWNIVEGSENASVSSDLSGENAYAGRGSVMVNFTDNREVIFDTGGSEMLTTVLEDGDYTLSYAVKKSDDTSAIAFTVNMYVNGVLQPNNTITQDLFDSGGFVNGQWNVYFQNVNLEQGDVLEFQFVAQSDTTDCKLWIDGLKLEILNRGTKFPSIYTEAKPIEINSSQIIDIPSIASNSSVIATATVTGAKVGMFVNINYPSALITDELIIGVPIVSATNTVSFVVHNHSGGSINPTSGTFKFRVYE